MMNKILKEGIKKRSKTRILKIALGLLFSMISLVFLKKYMEFNSSFNSNTKPISYLFLEKRINKGAGGESYEMDFKFNNQHKSISITSKEYYLIDEKKYPELYYSKDSDSIFSEWEKKKALRIAILFFGLFVITIVSFFLVKKEK